MVIDGYLEGAIVCVDSDNDGTCKVAATGADEANLTTTAADGSYTLPNTVADGAYILVETTADTVDADVPGKKFSEYGAAEGAVDADGTALVGGRPQYKLMAPAATVDGQEKFIVTPLTTMVANAMQEDPSLTTPALAAASIVGSMGVDPAKFNLFADYKATGTQVLDADTKDKLSTMANIVADSMGRSQQVLNAVVPTGQEADLRRQLFKESISQTWTLMASNVKPDGGLVMNKAAFQGALEKTVAGERQAIVTRAVFAKDLPEDVVIPPGPEAMLENNSRNLYIGSCRNKATFSSRASSDAKLSKYGALSPESLFCDSDDYATVATLRIGANDPWPVPMTGMRVSGTWRHAPGNGEGFFGLSGQNMILTELGWENYDYSGVNNAGQQLTCASGGFRPRTAGGGEGCTKLVQTTIPAANAADANCITFAYNKAGAGDVYGEKYCFNPIPLAGKKVGALDPDCLGETTAECTGGSSFAEGAFGFDVRSAFAFDTYILHPKRYEEADEGATDSTTIADMIAEIGSSGEAVDICDAKTTAYFSYYFTFDTAAKTMKLVAIDIPRKDAESGKVGCANGAKKGDGTERSFATATPVTAEGTEYCKLGFHDEKGGKDKDVYKAFCVDGKDGPLKRLKISQETAPYEIVDVSIAGGAAVKIFRTGAFASTKAITKAATEALSNSATGKSFQPSGFIATVVDKQVRFGEYWKKNATVKELSFMSGNEKVFNAKAGETILGGADVFNGSTVIQPVE